MNGYDDYTSLCVLCLRLFNELVVLIIVQHGRHILYIPIYEHASYKGAYSHRRGEQHIEVTDVLHTGFDARGTPNDDIIYIYGGILPRRTRGCRRLVYS